MMTRLGNVQEAAGLARKPTRATTRPKRRLRKRPKLRGELTPGSPSLLDNPVCPCNGSFDHVAREWHHHASCLAFSDKGGKICGH